MIWKNLERCAIRVISLTSIGYFINTDLSINIFVCGKIAILIFNRRFKQNKKLQIHPNPPFPKEGIKWIPDKNIRIMF